MSSLAVRSELALKPFPYYFERMFEALSDAWSPENPDGYILAAIAENGTSDHVILDKLNTNSADIPLPVDILKYNEMHGRYDLRAVVCELLTRTMLRGLTATPENLLMSTGTSSVLDNVSFLLADSGSSCLIPAPYYPVFDMDLESRNNITPWPVYLEGPENDTALLDSAKRSAEAARKPPRILLVANPDNPTGVIHNEDRMKGLVRWCVRHKIHLVVDEVFALSVFAGRGTYRGVMDIASDVADTLPQRQQETLWEHVHMVWGFSKDFCMSGMRASCLYTYNQKLIEAYHNIAQLSAVCSLTQFHLLHMLSDTSFVDTYVADNAAALEAQAAIVTDALTSMGVPFVQPEAGFFVWMDLAKKLGIEDWERERDIWGALLDKAKVYLVPGRACHAKDPGRYRICFCSHPPEATHDMMARLQHFIDQYKVKEERQNWNTQGFMLTAGFGSRR